MSKRGMERYTLVKDGCTKPKQTSSICEKNSLSHRKRKSSYHAQMTSWPQKELPESNAKRNVQLIKQGGVCYGHGENPKLCSSKGCMNMAKKRGVCIRQGANVEHRLCSSKGCVNKIQNGGVCRKHEQKPSNAAVKDA